MSFTKEEALRFLDTVKGHRLEAIFTVALALGMREGEILGLRWQDVNLATGKLGFPLVAGVKRPGETKGKLELIEPKTDRSSRVIRLPQVAISALYAHRARQEEERKEAGSRWRETGMVFATSIGTMLDQRNMLRAFYAIMDTRDPDDPEPDPKKKRKLLPRLRFHDLRHSAATLLLAGSAPAVHHGTARPFEHHPHDEHLRARPRRDETGNGTPDRCCFRRCIVHRRG